MLERAAQQAEDLVEAARADSHPEAGARPEAAQLAAAEDAQRAAAQELAQAEADQHAAPHAAAAMHEAAQDLRAAAQPPSRAALAENENPAPAPPHESPTPTPHAAEAAVAESDLSELQALIRARTGRAWGELPGHLRTELLQMSQGRYRDDYARLIQLYFREIAAGGPEKAARP